MWLTSENLPSSPEGGDENLLRRAGRFAGWAARTGFTIGKRLPLPGLELAGEGLRQVERQVLTGLRRRLDEVDDPYVVALSAAGAEHAPNGTGELVPAREPLRAAMKELLDRSVGFGREQAREYLYATVLRQLTPDEARIIATLATGAAFPVIDVTERGFGGGRTILRNASTVGKAAGVTLADEVPGYLTRLAGFGLVELDDESAELESQYEILATEDLVRSAAKSARRARLVRRTVRLSRFGVRFWAACDPGEWTRVL
ncbi:Abi-alpha family protein [Amycolatopsis thermoflava]|uniref:Uncharacterized protein DUF4393 n=1 Tax=Amycolatopsis thermoflava TaxID=84480 RepID=A0A3N2GYN0_9PSEU|nr:Abi-alpha family protein [Amycolatopsis thermoflava]ROS41723.1 uncharacterized protein DUF4393 [Amycolatopsis thermoflava]